MALSGISTIYLFLKGGLISASLDLASLMHAPTKSSSCKAKINDSDKICLLEIEDNICSNSERLLSVMAYSSISVRSFLPITIDSLGHACLLSFPLYIECLPIYYLPDYVPLLSSPGWTLRERYFEIECYATSGTVSTMVGRPKRGNPRDKADIC